MTAKENSKLLKSKVFLYSHSSIESPLQTKALESWALASFCLFISKNIFWSVQANLIGLFVIMHWFSKLNGSIPFRLLLHYSTFTSGSNSNLQPCFTYLILIKKCRLWCHYLSFDVLYGCPQPIQLIITHDLSRVRVQCRQSSLNQ